MKNKKRWLALSLAVCMTASTVTTGAFGDMQVAHAEEAAEQALELHAEAIPRYKSIRINWSAVSGHTYTIARSEDGETGFTNLTTNAAGPEYIDETAGKDVTRYYKITDNSTQEVTEVFSNAKATGIKALADRAAFKWINDEEDPVIFDGKTMLSFEGSDIEDVKELSEGTIIYKGYQETSSGNDDKVLLGFKNGSKSAYFGERGDRRNQVGIDFSALITNWKLAFGPSFVGSESSKHAVGYISPKPEAAGPMFISVDGSANTNPSWTSAQSSFGGFMKRRNLTEVTIGGFGSPSAATNAWKGAIDYVLITGEVLSQDEVKAITSEKPNLEPDRTAMNAKATPGYSSIKLTWEAKEGSTYKISRASAEDGNFTNVQTGFSGSQWVDEDVAADAVWYYKITDEKTGEETEAFANRIATGIDALKKYAAFKWINDGSTTFNGSKAVRFSGDAIEKVKGLTQGTILAKGYQASAQSGDIALLGLKKGSTTGFIGTRTSGDWGWSLANLISGWNIIFNGTAGFSGSASSQHAMAYVSPAKSPSTAMRLAFDGVNKTNTGWSSGSYGGFMSQMGITELSIGGLANDSNAVTNGWNGNIEYVVITDEVLTQEEINKITAEEKLSGPIASGDNIGEMFNNSYDNNSWVFTGGEDVQGGFEQVKGARNYVGQFEEYVRWQKSVNEYGRQRYTINTAKKGQTLKEVVTNWSSRVAAYDPKAVAYMVGSEDYSKDAAGVEDFKVQLKSFIDKSLALRSDGGFAVIQKPYAVTDAADNAKIEKYCKAVDQVVAQYAGNAKLRRIVVVDHYTQTNNSNFKTTKLTNGKLNVQGHFEIGRQLSLATIKTDAGYPADHAALAETEEPAASVYSEAVPTVLGKEKSLCVSIPEEAAGTDWKYTLKIDGVEIADTVSGREFEIVNLPNGKDYTLTVRTADGTTQLKTVEGIVADGEKSHKKVQKLNEAQKALKAKMDTKSAMTWLFMGDSITHAAMWTDGYDGIAQSFEKFLKDDLGRKDDVVINTAVSGATTQSTLAQINQRLDKYTPDVVSIMLGTNDCATGNYTPDKYETELKQIIQKAKNKGAIVVLRTPTSGQRDNNLQPYLAKMKKVADEDKELLYVDQYTEMKKVYTLYPYIYDDFYLDYGAGTNNMGLHPGPNGHLIMTRQFIRGCGLWTDDSNITNLFYKIRYTDESKTAELPFMKSTDKIGLSVNKVKEAIGRNIGSLTITAADGTKSYTTSTALGGDETILTDLKSNKTYTVSVKAYLTDSERTITFAPVEIALSDDTEVDFNIGLSNLKVRELKAGTEVGTFTVSEMAPAGDYTYELCQGTGDSGNSFFTIEDNKLVTAKELEEKQKYSIRVKAVNGKHEKEEVFEILAVGRGLIFEEKNITIAEGSSESLAEKEYAAEVKALEEGTIIVQYTSTGSFVIQSLFSVSNSTSGNNDRHFHVYVKPDGTLGFEIRNTDAQFKKSGAAANAVKPIYKGKAAKNTIAFKADKANNQYKLFANGKLVATIDAAGYKFISDIMGVNTVNIGATIRGGAASYTFAGNIDYVQGYSVPLSDDELKEITSATAFDDLNLLFNSKDATGSGYFRIPALITTKAGTVIAAIDARFGGTCDSENNIDTAVRRSTDGGKTWEDATMPLHFDEYADDNLNLPLGGNTLRVGNSASYIDPQLLLDGEKDRVFVIADAMPSGIGSPNSQVGSGYKTIGDKKYRMLKKKGETAYNYSIHDDNYIYNDSTGEQTEYSVNGNFEILKNGELQKVKQKTVSYDPTSANGAILETTTDKEVPMNIMYNTADFTVFPTNYLYMKYSDDQGKTWSDPIDLNKQIRQENQKYLIAGPGRGMQITTGKYKGRLLIPVYQPSGCAVIYSDDHGENWTYAAGPNVSAVNEMTESQIVEMPDGSLKVFARTYRGHIAMATSLDGGETWSAGTFTTVPQSSSGTQLSVINYGGLIDGKPAIILSTPVGSGGRVDGRVKIGLITDTGNAGVDRYTIDWAYDYQIDSPSIGYSYSCLTELPNHNIGVLYEKYDSWAPQMVQSRDVIVYEELSFTDLRDKASVEVNPISGGNGTVSQREVVDKDSEVTVVATPNENSRFESWTDKDGNVVSTDAEYTFTISENTTLKANFIRLYKVTVDDKVVQEDVYNAKVTLKAEERDGYTFAGWKVGENIVSTKTSYTFYLAGDIAIESYYVQNGQESEKQKADAQMSNTIVTDRPGERKSDVKFVGQLVIPEGYQLVNAGLIWSTKDNTVLELGTGLNPTYITAISNTNQFSVTIKGLPYGYFLRGRIFATIRDEAGKETVIYSDEKKVETAN